MKTITLTIAAVLTLHAGILFAGNDTYPAPVKNDPAPMVLAPVVPLIATFEELELPATDIALLAPVTPSEADFTDSVSATTDIIALAPAAPLVADFE